MRFPATRASIIAAQPTRGLDIGATEYVREQLLEQRRKGAAIMLISEDLDEILALSDRIAVIYEGQIMDIVPRENATPEKLGLLMAGVHPEEWRKTPAGLMSPAESYHKRLSKVVALSSTIQIHRFGGRWMQTASAALG